MYVLAEVSCSDFCHCYSEIVCCKLMRSGFGLRVCKFISV